MKQYKADNITNFVYNGRTGMEGKNIRIVKNPFFLQFLTISWLAVHVKTISVKCNPAMLRAMN